MGTLPTRSTFSTRIGVATLGSVAPELQLALALGRLDEDVLVDPIVHELMHHAAANSAVNIALQYRWLAFLRAALSAPHLGAGDPRIEEMAADLAAAEALIQPIAEGLAQFSEFDCALPDPGVAPSHYDVTATGAVSVRLLLLKRNATGVVHDLHRASVAEKLAQAQTSRRADVLQHPLYPRTANDAYLLGYLVIKAVWDTHVAQGGAERVPAGDFVEFLHYWFYEDWRLAELLLQRGPSGEYGVLDRLLSRIRKLLSDGDLPERVEAFKRDKVARQARGLLMRGREEREHGPFAGLGLEPDDIDHAQTALVAFHVAHVSPEAPVTEDAAVDPETAADLQHQTLVTPLPEDHPSVTAYHERRVAFAGATLRSLDFVLELPERKRALGTLLNAAIEVNVADGGVIALRVPGGEWEPAPAGLTTRLEGAGVHPARLVGVMMSTETPWRLYCFILVDGTIQSAWSHGADDDEEAKEVGETIAYEQEFERISGLTLDALASESVGSHLATRATTASARADDATLAISMTLREALSGHGWGALFATSPAKPDSGLRTRLPGRLISALALTGLVNAYSVARTEVAERLAERRFDLDALIAACDEAAAQGVKLLDADPDAVRALI